MSEQEAEYGAAIKAAMEQEVADLVGTMSGAKALRARVAELEAEVKGLYATLDAGHNAYKRGAERFRAAHPEYVERRMYPDMARLVEWLLEQLAAAEARAGEAEQEIIGLQNVQETTNEAMRIQRNQYEERLAAAESRAERVETAARALVEVAYSEEGDMGVRWYAVEDTYIDVLAKVLGIEQPGDLGEEAKE